MQELFLCQQLPLRPAHSLASWSMIISSFLLCHASKMITHYCKTSFINNPQIFRGSFELILTESEQSQEIFMESSMLLCQNKNDILYEAREVPQWFFNTNFFIVFWNIRERVGRSRRGERGGGEVGYKCSSLSLSVAIWVFNESRETFQCPFCLPKRNKRNLVKSVWNNSTSFCFYWDKSPVQEGLMNFDWRSRGAWKMGTCSSVSSSSV